MAHHEQDIALLQVVKGCTFRKNAPDKFVGDLTATLLVRAPGITIEDSASYFSRRGTLNGDRIGKFTSSVGQGNREQLAILLMSKGFMQPFKNLCDRPCGVSFPQKCQHEIGVTKEHRKQHLATLTALHGIHFHNGNIRIGCCIFYANSNGILLGRFARENDTLLNEILYMHMVFLSSDW